MASNSNDNNQATESLNRARRSSITSQTFTNLFGRSNSVTGGGPTPPFPGPITTAAAQDQRRRMSIGTLGLSGSPTQAGAFFGGRRGSISTAGSDSIDENAIEDDDGPARGNPATPFTRRMSFGAQALRNVRGTGGGSPGSSAEGNFNWGEQVRSRAESSVSQNQRPSFSTSPGFNKISPAHDRTKSISEMPAPPTAVPVAAPRPAPKKPDAFQERILKGDFYMD